VHWRPSGVRGAIASLALIVRIPHSDRTARLDRDVVIIASGNSGNVGEAVAEGVDENSCWHGIGDAVGWAVS
jgi:hypothetical protein